MIYWILNEYEARGPSGKSTNKGKLRSTYSRGNVLARTLLHARTMATVGSSDAQGFHTNHPQGSILWGLESQEIIRDGLVRSRVSMEPSEGVTRCVPRAEYPEG
eukprot:6200884-Pleurochrysis_carterae.AAC.5